MKNRLLIIGAGGHGRVVADIALTTGRYIEISFLDDANPVDFKYPILGKVNTAHKYIETHDIFVAIGNANVRKRIMKELNTEFVTLIHKSSVIGLDVKIGQGTVVMPGAIINAGAVVGDGVIVNTSTSIDHDCIVGDYCHVSVGSHLCGTVNVGDKTWIGAGATIVNNINICDNCMIGAGAVVVKDINESGTYIGVPAVKV